MKTKEVQSLYEKFILPTYTQIPVCLVKGKGSRVWDLEGNEYLDFFPGWAVSALGHCHPSVVSAVKKQASKILHISNNFLNLKQAQLAQEISNHAFPAKTFFCNSGAEAAEGAIKFARKFGAGSRYEIITFRKSFHGRTMGAVAATAQDKIQNGFQPLLEGFRYATFNDLDSVKAAVTDKTIGIFLEPIQGEGGVQIATEEFIKGLRYLCDLRKILLMFDEVQTGMGRTGKMFAFQHYGVEPEVMTLAKALGGGVPIGALVINDKVAKGVFGPGSHGSTYGGNPLVTAAALGVFRAIKKDGLLKKSKDMGAYLLEKLSGLKEKFSVITDARGLGLMCALELSQPGAPVVDAARKKGLLINCTQDKVLRIMPAMTVSKKQVDKAVKILEESFQEAYAEAKAV
ncbi:MAG TPA: aspartate aminotransferase family protein [Verrucomicrobiae bacterium]|nr:aspartate aminotransferase family protein [Verrucomicrobiae bacterium]